MTQEELSRLHTGDRITNKLSGYDYVVTSTFPVVATRTIDVTNPAEWVLSTGRKDPFSAAKTEQLSDAAAVALSLNGKQLSMDAGDFSSSRVVIAFVDEEWDLNVRGAIHGSGTAEGDFPAQFRINQIGLMEIPCGQRDGNDADLAELRDHCEAWLSALSIIIDTYGNLSGSAVELGYRFRQANGRAGVCIDLDRLPKGKS